MESSTKILRRMLDERGVEWTEGIARPELTQVRIDGKVVKFHPWQPNTLKVSLFDITPEQAIAATLGAEDAYTREDVESAFVSGYSLGCLPVGSDPTWDQNEQTVDEYMAEWGWVRKEATLGSCNCSCNCSSNCTNGERTETCHVESSIIDTYEYNRWEYELSCGHTIIWEDSEPPRYCPECGRRIEQ